MSKLFLINGVEVKPGKQAEISLKIARLPTHTEINLPVFVYRGKKDGPVLLLTASLHGDEVNGTETLRRMIRNKSLMPQVGTVIAMPVVNVYGFLLQTRALPDGKDLNRSFPGSPGGSLARRLAHIILSQVVVHADYAVDLHTGGARRTNYPQVRCDFERPGAVELANAFCAPFLLNSKEIPGSFRKSASNNGTTMIVFEGGESQRHDELSIKEAMDGIHRTMAYLGMVESKLPEKTSLILGRSQWIRAKISGMLISYIEAGAFVKKGQPIAQLGDPFGETAYDVVAPFDAYVIGLNNQPIISAGDAVIHLGVEDPQSIELSEDAEAEA